MEYEEIMEHLKLFERGIKLLEEHSRIFSRENKQEAADYLKQRDKSFAFGLTLKELKRTSPKLKCYERLITQLYDARDKLEKLAGFDWI